MPSPPPGDLPDPGIEQVSPALQAHSLPAELPGKLSSSNIVSLPAELPGKRSSSNIVAQSHENLHVILSRRIKRHCAALHSIIVHLG